VQGILRRSHSCDAAATGEVKQLGRVRSSAIPLARAARWETLGIQRAIFHRWYDRFLAGGFERSIVAGQARRRYGTAFPKMCETGSSSWLSTSRNCRRRSWRRASPTRKVISFQKLASTGCARRMILDGGL